MNSTNYSQIGEWMPQKRTQLRIMSALLTSPMLAIKVLGCISIWLFLAVQL